MSRFFNVVARGDLLLSVAIQKTARCEVFEKIMKCITHIGDSHCIILFPFCLIFAGGRQFISFGIIGLIAIFLSFLFTTSIKGYLARPRPKYLLRGETSRKGFFNEYAFPSGHTSAAFSVAVTLSFAFPQWQAIFFLMAALVGYSRIFLGEHYPSDVMVGAIIGCIFTVTLFVVLT